MNLLSLLLVLMISLVLCCDTSESRGDTFFDKKGKFSLSGFKDYQIEKKDGNQGQTSYHAVGFHKGDETWIWVLTGERSERNSLSADERVETLEQVEQKLHQQFGVDLENPWQKKYQIEGVEGWGYGARIPSKNIVFKSVAFEHGDNTYSLSLTTTNVVEADTLWNHILSGFKFLKQ